MPFPGSLAASGGCPETNLCGGLVDMLSSLPRLGLAVEVGSFRGVSTEVLAHFADRVICVDPWAAWPRAKKEFDARFAAAQSVSYLRMTSVEAAGIVADGVADLVYIDAMHDRESVLRDIGALAAEAAAGRLDLRARPRPRRAGRAGRGEGGLRRAGQGLSGLVLAGMPEAGGEPKDRPLTTGRSSAPWVWRMHTSLRRKKERFDSSTGYCLIAPRV
jgi:hypothetical protein